MLQNQKALAVCWDESQVQAAALSQTDNGIRCDGYCVQEIAGNLSDTLSAVKTELSPDEETTLIVGGDVGDFCIVDLDLPELAASDLRAAVKGEMSRHYPGNVDDIVFASRRCADGYRVFYMTRPDWQSMTDALSAFAPLGVDRIIPVAAALDPLYGGQDVGVSSGEQNYLVVSKDNGGRELQIIDEDDQRGTDISLSIDAYPEELGPEPGILAEYALSETYMSDGVHAFKLPDFIRPRRFESLKRIALISTVCMLVLLVATLGLHLRGNGSAINKLDAAIMDIRQDMDAIDIELEQLSRNQKLEDEFLPLKKRHDKQMTVALASLSYIIDRKLWAVSYSWENSDIKIELHSTAEVNDVVKKIQNTRLFDDVRMQKRKQSNGKIYYRITCRLKDLEGEVKGG